MAFADFGVTPDELASLARVCNRDADALRHELSHRPWALYDILSEPDVIEAVLEPKSLLDTPSPFTLFAVLVRLAADQLLQTNYVNDWIGPRSRLPVFDVEPLQEFVCAPGRVLFVARLLTSMVTPPAGPTPIPSLDPWELVDWLDAVNPEDRVVLLRRLGDLSLFIAGVQADAHGADILSSAQAEKVGHALRIATEEVLALVDPASVTPGLDTLEGLGARWYQEARRTEPRTPPVVGDIAERIHAARRFLTHLTDSYLAPFAPLWQSAA
jgi:hypothetical protein